MAHSVPNLLTMTIRKFILANFWLIDKMQLTISTKRLLSVTIGHRQSSLFFEEGNPPCGWRVLKQEGGERRRGRFKEKVGLTVIPKGF